MRLPDAGLQAVVAVDLKTGNRSILSDDETGTGPNLYRPYGIVLDTDNHRALVADGVLYAVVAIDLKTGNRKILSGALTPPQ